MLFALLLCASCTGINTQGDYCHKDKNCEVYVPFYTPTKLFVKSAFDISSGSM